MAPNPAHRPRGDGSDPADPLIARTYKVCTSQDAFLRRLAAETGTSQAAHLRRALELLRINVERNARRRAGLAS